MCKGTFYEVGIRTWSNLYPTVTMKLSVLKRKLFREERFYSAKVSSWLCNKTQWDLKFTQSTVFLWHSVTHPHLSSTFTEHQSAKIKRNHTYLPPLPCMGKRGCDIPNPGVIIQAASCCAPHEWHRLSGCSHMPGRTRVGTSEGHPFQKEVPEAARPKPTGTGGTSHNETLVATRP